MSACAVMVARDEADIVAATVRHALWHFDEVIAADHRSVDGTREILEKLPVVLRDVKVRGFHGDLFWTWMAAEAFARGHDWVVVNDADDVWHVTADPAVRVADWLARLEPHVRAVAAMSYNHVPTALDDPSERNPLRRIGWRQQHADARKVACRLRPDFRYARHNAFYDGVEESPTDGLTVRHFTIRTAEQLVRKVRNGMDGYSVEAGMPAGFDRGWDQWRGLGDDAIADRFYSTFWSQSPHSSLAYDPAPARRSRRKA